MAYKKSNARKSFDSRASHLKACSKTASTKARMIPREVRDLTFHAAILETSAALEEYIKNLLEDYVYRLREEGLSLDKLPKEMRTFLLIHSTLPHYERLISSHDERKALENLDVESDVFSILDKYAPVGRSVHIGVLLDKKKYPSPKNWTTLFRRFGIRDIFLSSDIRLKRDTKSLLQSFNDVRTALAHGEAPELTYEDVVRHLENMKSFVGAVDRVLCAHFCKHSGQSASWPA